MTLSELFLAVNAAAIRLSRHGNELKLHGTSIPAELTAALAMHKGELLGLLADEQPDPEDLAEHREIQREGCRLGVDHIRVAQATAEWDHVTQALASPAGRLARFDWRLEWLITLGTLYLRLQQCRDADVSARLQDLARPIPGSEEDWLTLGTQIQLGLDLLRQEGKLPGYPWPPRGDE